MTRKASLVVVAALVAVGLAAVGAVATTGSAPAATDGTTALQGNETNATTGNGTDDATGNDARAANATANVTFVDQTSNGSAVFVNNTSLPAGGFVVIHVVENATFGAVVGNSSYLEPGVHANVTITLDPPIDESQTLIAMPHRDTNENRTYDFPAADDPYVANGSSVTDEAFVVVAQPAGNATMANATNATMGNATNATGNATNATTGNETGNASDATGNSSVGA